MLTGCRLSTTSTIVPQHDRFVRGTIHFNWAATVSKIIHYKPFGWAATACRLSPLKFPALICTIDPHQVDCKNCLSVIQAVGDGALHADAIREITALTLDIATKQDLAALKARIEDLFREFATGKVQPRYMSVAECAAYIGRTPRAVFGLLHKGAIPHIRLGRRVQFDRERIDRWIDRHARRGRLLSV
jgi:excisionase family DNA binding protein